MSNPIHQSEPPQAAVDQIIGLYNQGQLEQTVSLAESLANQYPNALILYDILGAAYMGLKNTEKTIASYQKALQLNPNHTDAYNNMGMAFYDQGRFDKAVESYKKAINLEPDFADAHYNLGNALKQMGDLKQAIESYKTSLALNPNDAEVLLNCGNALKSYGDFEQAIKIYVQALKIDPNSAAAQTSMDNADKEKAEIDKLVADYARGAKLQIGSAEIVSFTGTLLKARGYLDAAIDSYKQAIKIKPDHADVHYNMGNALYVKGELEAAIDNYKQAIKLKPDYADAYLNMGNALKDSGSLYVAIDSFKHAIKVKSDYAEAYSNMGNILKDQGKLDAAIENYKHTIRIRPDYAEAYNNMGIALKNKGELNAAIDTYEQAIKIKPDYADAICNKSAAYLSKEDFRNGWLMYEWRWRKPSFNSVPLQSKKPKWQINQGNRVLIWSEQGVGDIIMFSSIILEIYKQSEKLILQIDERLIPLFSRSFPKDISYYSCKEKVPEEAYDTHIPFGSLPMHFRPDVDSFKNTSGTYLKAEKNLSTKLRKTLREDSFDYIVGLTWRGGSNKKSVSTNKSVDLVDIAQLLTNCRVKIVNLQYGDTKDECKRLNTDYGLKVHNVSEVDNFNDIDGFAALVDACDHIVSTDNLTVHIAGALGKKTTVLLPFSADWRWGLEREDSYWHSSLRLLRQENISDWSVPLEKLQIDFDCIDVKLNSNKVDQTIGGQST